MKAISLWQPWASLVALNEKRFETRGWETSHRGRIAIHAAKRWTPGQINTTHHSIFREALDRPLGRLDVAEDSLRFGAIIAMARIEDCVPTEKVLETEGWRRHAAEFETEFGNYAPGRFAWLLGDVLKLKDPVPCRGYQKIWNLELPIMEKIQRQLVTGVHEYADEQSPQRHISF